MAMACVPAHWTNLVRSRIVGLMSCPVPDICNRRAWHSCGSTIFPRISTLGFMSSDRVASRPRAVARWERFGEVAMSSVSSKPCCSSELRVVHDVQAGGRGVMWYGWLLSSSVSPGTFIARTGLADERYGMCSCGDTHDTCNKRACPRNERQQKSSQRYVQTHEWKTAVFLDTANYFTGGGDGDAALERNESSKESYNLFLMCRFFNKPAGSSPQP